MIKPELGGEPIPVSPPRRPTTAWSTCC